MKNAVLITGGAKRLGSLIAQQLSKEDYFIIIHYNKSESEAIRTKEKILENGGDVVLIKRNIKSASDASELILEALSFVKKNSVNQFTLIINASAFVAVPTYLNVSSIALKPFCSVAVGFAFVTKAVSKSLSLVAGVNKTLEYAPAT